MNISSETNNGPPTPTEQSSLLNHTETPGNEETGDRGSDTVSPDNDNVPLAEEPDTGQLLLVLSSVWVGVLFAAADGTIVATLSAPISSHFDSLSLFSWLASSYYIANAALQPLSGKLTDILSRRTGLIFSNIFFAAGNLICGLATTEWAMVLGRIVAGMGGGGLTAISTFVTSDLVPLRRRGLWQGFGNLCYGLGSGLGGVFGGWMHDAFGWRWAFLVQVPFVIISGFIVFFTVKIPVKETQKSLLRRIDFVGSLTLMISLILLLFGLNSGGNSLPWSHPLVLISLPVSVLFLCLFIYVESRNASEPIIPVRLLLVRTVMSACLTNWFTTMAVFGILFYTPIYFQLQGYSATQAGIRLIPQAVGGAFGSLGAGLIMRRTGKYYVLSCITMALLVVSGVLVSTFEIDSPAWQPFIYLALGGLCYGSMLTITLVALISAVEHKDQAVITSASYAFRSTGSTIGITICSAVFQNILKAKLWSKFGDRKDASAIIPKIRDSLDEIDNLPQGWRKGVFDIYMSSLKAVFLTITGLSVLAALASLAMREHKLHTNLARK